MPASSSFSSENSVPFVDPTDETAHRPWPLPETPWIQRMRLHDHLFVHWPIEATSLRDLVPGALSIDTFEGVGWVGITAFRLSKVGLRYLPDVPLAPSFLALAVRTYVTGGDKPGIWFFSIDVSNKIIGLLGKSVFGVPFFNARMALETGYAGTSLWSRRADRRAPAIEFDALYSPFGESFRAEAGSLEEFLTRRYCFYAETSDRALYRTEFHHKPWILRPADGTCLINDYLPFHKIETPALPLLCLSELMDVVLYSPTKL